MSGLYESAMEFEAFFRARGWRFCFIGGLAVLRWGVPRITLDVDISVLTGWDDTERYVDEVVRHFAARMNDAAAFARENRVLLVKSSGGTPADISMAALPFEEEVIGRASLWRVQREIALTTCSAEDLLVYKAFANRARDWDDIAGIVRRQGRRLNEAQVMGALRPLCEARGESEVMERLARLMRQTEEGP